jgi:uncharacterized integral membrane protein
VSTSGDVRPSGAGPPSAPAGKNRSPLPAKENRRLIAGLVVGAVVAVFAAVNASDVEVDWLATTTQTPLIVVIAVAFALGAFVGWIAHAAKRRGG